MRTALAAAVHCLLNDPRLSKTPFITRLAALVLLAKAPATSSRVRILYRDLAGWLGCSLSHVGHTVLPSLKQAGVVTSQTDRDSTGTKAIVLDLLPLREARAAHGTHPLALLSREDLATLLRMCEAVTCPGWAPPGKPQTPAGFMAERRGHHAALDRLAMVLLVLEARRDGQVRMAPGRVTATYGRAEATLARLLGCSLATAALAISRLKAMDAIELQTEPRNRVRVPAVATAFARARKRAAATELNAPAPLLPPRPCTRCANLPDQQPDGLELAGNGWTQESFEDALAQHRETAFRDQSTSATQTAQLSGRLDPGTTTPYTAGLHTHHTPCADLSAYSAGDLHCFSGSAVSSSDGRPERAHAHEDHLRGSAVITGADEPQDRPLRGEKRMDSSRRSPTPQTKRPVQEQALLPVDLNEALRPVQHLWSNLTRASTRRWLAKFVRGEVARLRGVVGPEAAEGVLAARLRRRMDEQRTRPVQDFPGWLRQRGLPQRPGCWSLICDDGTRMDTAGPCDSCACLIGDRQSLRRGLAADIANRHPQLTTDAHRHLLEHELRVQYAQNTALDQARREHEARERRRRDSVALRQRTALAQAQTERAEAPCRRCGVSSAGGLCLTCTLSETTQRFVNQAVDVTVALRADFTDRAAVERLVREVEQDSWAVVRRVNPALEANERAYAERERARELLRTRTATALRHLEGAEPAEAEAALVQRTHKRRVRTGAARVEEPVPIVQVRTRAAQALLTDTLEKLHHFRADSRTPRPWTERLSDIAARPLPEDHPVEPPIVVVFA